MFSIFFFCCKKQNTEHFTKKEVTDSLLVEAETTKDAKLKLKIANKIFNEIRKGDFDSISRKNYIRVTRIYYSLNNPKYIEICKLLTANPSEKVDHYELSFYNYLLGNYYYNNADYEDAFISISKAEKSFRKLNKFDYLAYTLVTKADILSFKKDFVGAEATAIKALKISKNIKNYSSIYNCYITLGNSLNGLNNYSKAIDYYQKAFSVTDNLKSESQYLTLKAASLNYIATVYQKKGEYYKAISLSKQALKLCNFKKIDPTIYCYLVNALEYSKFKLGDKTSIDSFLETLKIGDSLKFAPIQITSKTHLGEYFLAEKDTLKSIFYLKDAQIQAHQNDIFEDELAILQLLAKANPNDKSFYSNRYISLNDSLQNVERATRDKFARIEFETDEITTQKNNLTVEKEGLSDQRWIIIGFSVFSLFIIVLWFKNKSQKAKTRELLLKQEQQKANEEIYQLMLDQQQKIQEGKNLEKQRISLELHDGVMGKLSAVRLNLYASLYKANLIEEEIFSKQIDEIQAVEQEIRTIAHDLNSSLFSDNSNFIAIVKELFAKIENHSQIQFTLSVSDAVNWDLINNTIKINLYRILQEALQNIEKYADANKVVVVMTKTETDEIFIAISDDGNGFNPHEKKDGIGIKNMKIRMEELNGTFDIQSELKKGTKINLIIPF